MNTSTPSIGNAAATWAGWAVTAVTAKFYRSQSDTRPRPPLTGKTLSKPASLGMCSLSLEHLSLKFDTFWLILHFFPFFLFYVTLRPFF